MHAKRVRYTNIPHFSTRITVPAGNRDTRQLERSPGAEPNTFFPGMVTTLAILFTCVLVARPILAQTSYGFSMYKIAGIAIASEYGNWSLSSQSAVTTVGTPVLIAVPSAAVTLSGGISLVPLREGIPVRMSDGLGNSETVTPNTVTCSSSGSETSCNFLATFKEFHQPPLSLRSTSAGLQEAIDSEAEAGGGIVAITPDWRGNSAVILTVQIPPTVLLQDERQGGKVLYGSCAGSPCVLASLSSSPVGVHIPTLSATRFEGIRFSDQFAGATAGAQADAAAEDIGTSSPGLLVIPPGTANGLPSTTASNLNWLDLRTGTTAQPEANRQFAYPSLFLRAYDDSAASSDDTAQGDSRLAPLTRFEIQESGQATTAPLYLFAKSVSGAGNGGLYGLVSAADVQQGARSNVVTAANLVAGLDNGYGISQIVRSSNIVTITTSVANTFQSGDFVHIQGVADGSFNTGTFGATIQSVLSSTSFTISQPGPDATASSGTVALDAQFFGLELDAFNDTFDTGPLTPASAQNITSKWGIVSTSNGQYPLSGSFFADAASMKALPHNDFVAADALDADFVAGYPVAGQNSLSAHYSFLSRPQGVASGTSYYGSGTSGWQDSIPNSQTYQEHTVTEQLVPLQSGSSFTHQFQWRFDGTLLASLDQAGNQTVTGQLDAQTISAAAGAFSVSGAGNLACQQMTSTGIELKGEVMSSIPRTTTNVFLPGSLISSWTAAAWTPDNTILITRIEAQAKTAPSGCTTQAVVTVSNGTQTITLPVTGSYSSSGLLSISFLAGSAITIAISTGATGCTVAPADVNLIIQYRTL